MLAFSIILNTSLLIIGTVGSIALLWWVRRSNKAADSAAASRYHEHGAKARPRSGADASRRRDDATVICLGVTAGLTVTAALNRLGLFNQNGDNDNRQ